MTMPVCVIAVSVLSACGGGGGPVERDVVVPTTVVDDTPDELVKPPTTTVLPTEDEPVLTPLDPGDDTPTSSAPVAVSAAQALDDLGTVAPVEIDLTDPVLLATLAAIAHNETPISSAVLVTDPATGERSVLTRDGLYARIDGSLHLADLAADVNNDVLGDYENAASFTQSDAIGIVGLATPVADLRTTGDASYEGGASGFVITGANGVDLIKGRSVVDVAFSVDSVTVTLDDFEGVSQITGFVVDSPVTEMILRNASIADGGFSGGTLTLRDANGMVDITGADTTTLAQGQFFGLNSDGETPDEAGGVILSQGDTGIVFGTFIAD
jgi:hypothetical protein